MESSTDSRTSRSICLQRAIVWSGVTLDTIVWWRPEVLSRSPFSGWQHLARSFTTWSTVGRGKHNNVDINWCRSLLTHWRNPSWRNQILCGAQFSYRWTLIAWCRTDHTCLKISRRKLGLIECCSFKTRSSGASDSSHVQVKARSGRMTFLSTGSLCMSPEICSCWCHLRAMEFVHQWGGLEWGMEVSQALWLAAWERRSDCRIITTPSRTQLLKRKTTSHATFKMDRTVRRMTVRTGLTTATVWSSDSCGNGITWSPTRNGNLWSSPELTKSSSCECFVTLKTSARTWMVDCWNSGTRLGRRKRSFLWMAFNFFMAYEDIYKVQYKETLGFDLIQFNKEKFLLWMRLI